MKKTLLAAIFLSCFTFLHAAGELFDFYIPWNDEANTIIDMSSFVNRNIDAEGFVSVDSAGHFNVNSGRIKFWGTNTTFGGNFPSAANAPGVAARLAKYGFNIVRFHHMDMFDIWTSLNPDRTISPAKFDRMDYFIYQLKQNGIYTDLNLLVSRPFAQGTELNADINLITEWKERAVLGFFDPANKALQKKFAYDLLTHVNPYTGNAYINEPAVAFIEINNENGLVHAFLSSQLDALPPYYEGLLNTQWNDWLKSRYASHAELEAAWNVINQPLGAEIILNGTFASGILSPWLYNPQPGVVGTGSVEAGTGPGGLNAARIDVTTAGGAEWAVQFNQGNLNVTAGVPYTVTFYAKADTDRTISVELGMDHDPWVSLGFRANLNLTSSWQLFTFSFTPGASDTDARLNFSGMGLASGASYWFTDISLKQGGMLGLNEGEDLYITGIDNFKRSFAGRTQDGQKDWYRFLTYTEENYWIEMRDYIKNTLGANNIIFGTILGCSNPNVQANFQAIDSHSYWEHPQFPATPWDPVNWYLINRAMVNYPAESTIASLAIKNVLNRPHLVTETNSPHPGTYSSDHSFMTSAYASFQDWDAVFPFDYNGDDNWNKNYIDNYFAVANNPLKMASYPAAVMSFYRGDIKPAAQKIVVQIDKAAEIDQTLSTWAWKLVDAQTGGENPKAAYVHGLEIAVEGQIVPAGAIAPGTTDVSGNILNSDTGELSWDNSAALQGVFTADTDMTKYLTGFTSGKTYMMSGGVTITPGTSLQPFSAIALTALDGNSFASAQKILVTALGCQKNTGDSWYTYPDTPIAFPPPHGAQVTLRNQWGTAPSMVEGVNALITLPSDPAFTTVWALDNTGARKTTVTVTDAGGFAQFGISPAYQAVWYEVEVFHSEYTPTATITITPEFSPTVTRTVTATSTITLTPTMAVSDLIDDCEILTDQNLWGGYWYTYKDTVSTGSGAKEISGSPASPGAAYHASGTIVTGGYAGVGTNLAPAEAETDISQYAGVQFYIKGNGTTNINLAIVTGNFSEIPAYNNWQYSFTPPTDWTFVQIPFSSLTIPYGTSLPLMLDRAKDIQWKIPNTGVFDVYIDDVALYYPQPSPTVTVTITLTEALSPTVTATHTVTTTFTEVLSPTATETHTITETQTDTATVTETVTITETQTQTPDLSPTATYTVSISVTQTNTLTVSPTVTVTDTPVSTSTPTMTSTSTLTATITHTKTATTTVTATRTITATASVTLTRTVITNTYTATITATIAADTPTITPTLTATPYPQADTLKVEDVLAYPNPFGLDGSKLKFRCVLTKNVKRATVNIYTASFRLVRSAYIKNAGAGICTIAADKVKASELSNGTYYYVITAQTASGEKASSKLNTLIVIK